MLVGTADQTPVRLARRSSAISPATFGEAHGRRRPNSVSRSVQVAGYAPGLQLTRSDPELVVSLRGFPHRALLESSGSEIMSMATILGQKTAKGCSSHQ